MRSIFLNSQKWKPLNECGRCGVTEFYETKYYSNVQYSVKITTNSTLIFLNTYFIH